MTYIIYIAKKRNPEDRYGISWGKVELNEYDEEKAKEKFDMLRLLFGDRFILNMNITERSSMTIEVAINVLNQIKELILNDKSWLESTHEPISQCFDMSIKSLEAWEHLKNKIQSIKIMKERELDTAGDLTTAYILRGEIGMLEVIITLISEQFSEVEHDD